MACRGDAEHRVEGPLVPAQTPLAGRGAGERSNDTTASSAVDRPVAPRTLDHRPNSWVAGGWVDDDAVALIVIRECSECWRIDDMWSVVEVLSLLTAS